MRPKGTAKPRFAMVSTDIRRDLIEPLRGYTRLELVHFYKQAPYQDLSKEDWSDSLVQYHSPLHLLGLLRTTRPDLVQNVELFALRQLPYVLVIYLYCLLSGAGLVAGVHISLPLWQRYGRAGAAVLRLLLYPVIRRTCLFFYLNEGGRRNLEWMGAKPEQMERHMYGTWGVDPEEFSPTRNGTEPDWRAPVILSVGRIHAEKGVFDLIAAFEHVQKIYPDTHLIFIGDGPHRQAAEAMTAKSPMKEQICFLGPIKNRELPSYFRAATIFAAPSVANERWEEYVGMTNLQAMACGVPVVTTQSGAIPEYVPSEAGLLVPESDPIALAEALNRLLEDVDLRREMGAAGRAAVLQRYNAGQNLKQAEGFLLRCCHQ